MNIPAKDVETGPLDTLGIHYLKSSLYRTVHADGAYGGVTPKGLLDVSFYSERRPIPSYVVHHVQPNGSLGTEIRENRISKDGIIRDLEVGIMLDLDTGRSLLAWLQLKVAELERIAANTHTESK